MVRYARQLSPRGYAESYDVNDIEAVTGSVTRVSVADGYLTMQHAITWHDRRGLIDRRELQSSGWSNYRIQLTM